MIGIELQIINPTFFLYPKGRCHDNQFCGKITYPLHLSLEMEWNIATSICALTAQITPLCAKKFVNFGPVTPEKTGLICEVFVRHGKKNLAYLVEYLRIYWTDFYDLFTK